MLKIVIAMIIGAALGAALTHEIMSRQPAAESTAAVIDDQRTPGPPISPEPPPAPAFPAAGDVRLPPAGSPIGVVSASGIGAAALRGGAQPVPDPVSDPAIDDAASFEAAFSYALTLDGEPWETRAALMRVALRWLTVAPRDAIAALDRLSTQEQRRGYIEGLAQAAIASRPELLGEIAAYLRGPNEQMAAVNAIGQRISGLDDPEAILDVAASLPGMLGQTLERMALAQMAQRDPREALARLDAMPQGEARNILLMSSITQLALRDPAGALSWLSARQGDVDASVYMSVATMLGQQNPDIAAQYASSVPENARAGWISAVARGMAARDVDGALNWLATWRNTDYYGEAIAGVAQQVAGFDPRRAAQLLSEVDGGSRQGRMAFTSVAAIWANSDPDAALGWARSLPRGDNRDRALITLAPRIGESMLEDSMLDLFSSPQMRDSAAGSAISAIARTDPQRAHGLIDTHISDPAMARRFTAMIDGTANASIASFAAPVGAIGIPPTGGILYTDIGSAVPQLTVGGDFTNVVIQREAVEAE